MPISNATNSSLSLTNVTVAESGAYSVDVSNAAGTFLEFFPLTVDGVSPLWFAPLTRAAEGRLSLLATGPAGVPLILDSSTNLTMWAQELQLTNLIGITRLHVEANSSRKFFRIRQDN